MNNLSNEELVNKFNSMRGLYMLYGKFQNERDFEQAEAISKELFATIAAGDEAVKKVTELEKEIKKWEDSRDGVLLSSQTKNYKIMELEKEVEMLKADKRELVEALEKIVLEFNQEANYLLKNSVGSDISVGNTYKECAKILKAAVAKHKEAL